jgi:beta-mannosidase
MQAFPLTDGWFLKERDPDLDIAHDFAVDAGWLPASVPGTVHQDLL